MSGEIIDINRNEIESNIDCTVEYYSKELERPRIPTQTQLTRVCEVINDYLSLILQTTEI